MAVRKSSSTNRKTRMTSKKAKVSPIKKTAKPKSTKTPHSKTSRKIRELTNGNLMDSMMPKNAKEIKNEVTSIFSEIEKSTIVKKIEDMLRKLEGFITTESQVVAKKAKSTLRGAKTSIKSASKKITKNKTSKTNAKPSVSKTKKRKPSAVKITKTVKPANKKAVTASKKRNIKSKRAVSKDK